MKAYMLLSRYYERKVLAAIYALVHLKGGRAADREKAEGLTDEAVQAYVEAANFMLETLDEDVKKYMGRPIGSGGWQYANLPQQIVNEKNDRQRMPEIFRWS